MLCVLQGQSIERKDVAENYDEIAITNRQGVVFRQRLLYGPNPVNTEYPRSASLTKPHTGESDASKLDPALAAQLLGLGPDDWVDVVVLFDSGSFKFPRLPDLSVFYARDSETNQAILTERQGAFEEVKAKRRAEQSWHVEKLRSIRGDVHDQFVLVNAIGAKVPVRYLTEAAYDPAIVGIEPRFSETPPPQDEVSVARELINSDPYYDEGFTGLGFFGLLDTGVYRNHRLLSGPSPINLWRDCTVGSDICENDGNPAYDPDDVCWNHGTSTAAILAGTQNLGSQFRGVTATQIDSWKVYPSPCGLLDTNAVLRAFDQAVFWGDKIIVAEMQPRSSDTGSIAMAADSAFDAGTLVIGANGNAGPNPGTVAAPANARKALGAGAYNVRSLQTPSYQSRGPTADGRIKPDLQTPTDTRTASRTCDDCTRAFGGTSGSTPYLAAAASVLSSWYESMGFDTEPGKIYAGLIAFGGNVYPFDNVEGAGKLVLSDLACSTWLTGARTLREGESVSIEFAAASGDQNLKAAIWWPETPMSHSHVDLFLIDPSNTARAAGTSETSVFERVAVDGALSPPGTWRIQLQGTDIPSGIAQTVYFLVYYTVAGCE